MATKALVIGSNGFLGSALSSYLRELQISVKGAYHINTDRLCEDIDQVKITDAILEDEFYDWIFICTAFIPKKEDHTTTSKLNKVNVLLTEKIVNTFSNAKIIYCSTVAVYPYDNGLKTEISLEGPHTEYGKSKLEAERIVKMHNNYAIVRFSSIYGKQMEASTFLPIVIKNAIKNNEICLFGDGSRKQNYIHVQDAVTYLLEAAKYEKSNEVFLATGSMSYSNKEIAEFVETMVGKKLIYYKAEDTSPSFRYNNEWSKTILGINDEVLISEGLKELIECT